MSALKQFIAGIQGIRQSHKLGAEVSNTSPASILYPESEG